MLLFERCHGALMLQGAQDRCNLDQLLPQPLYACCLQASGDAGCLLLLLQCLLLQVALVGCDILVML